LLTKFLNQQFIITREIKNAVTGVVLIPSDYSQLGGLFFTVMILGFALPMLTIYIVNRTLFSDK
jgi:hypothetical protein